MFMILALWALDQDLSIETFRKMSVPVPIILATSILLPYLAVSRPTEGQSRGQPKPIVLWVNETQSIPGPCGPHMTHKNTFH
jgi:hypothetical protein